MKFGLTLILWILFSFYAFAGSELEGLRGWDIRIAGLVGKQTYGLSAEGFNVSSGVGQSLGEKASVTYRDGTNAFYLSHVHLGSRHGTPDQIDPSEIPTHFQRTQLGMLKPFVVDGDERPTIVQLISSLEFRRRVAPKTMPNTFMPTNEQVGVYLGLLKEFEWSGLWSSELSGGLFVPLFFDEQSEKTGYRKFSLNPDAAFDFVYRLNHFIDFSLGLHVTYELNAFSGTGTRGSTNATESFMNLYIPIELRFQF